jgi:hypothetical protein
MQCVVRLGVCAALALAALGATAGPAGAQDATQCVARVDGQSTDQYHDPGHSLELDVDSVHRIEAFAPADATNARIEVETPVGSREIVDVPVVPNSIFDQAVQLDEDVAPWGVGLYRVDVSAGSCEQTIWVRLTGRHPLTTVSGIAGSAAVLAGLGLIGIGVVRAVRKRRGVVLGALGGALGGIGALVLSQQFGWIAITPLEIVTWVVLPAAGGAAVTAASALLSSGAAASAPAPLPAPPPTSAAPPPAVPPSAPPSAPAPAPAAPPPVEAVPPPLAEAGAPPVEALPPPRASANGGGAAADPPRESYARMEAPEAVVADDTFELIVGLAAEPVAGVLNPRIVRPASSVGAYTLVVQVVADGFSLAGSDASGADGWRRELPVTAAEPYPFVTYRLRAERQPGEVWSRPIQALFSIDGQTVGVAIRTIAVVGRAELLGTVPAAEPPAEANVIAIAPQEDAPDLTARITYSEAVSDGRLLWTFETTHGLDLPATEVVTDVGSRPEIFAKELIEGVASHRGDAGLVEFLTGVGRSVSEKVPPEFFTLLAAVAAKLDRPPRVLLLSQEPYVPWELASVEPPLDPGAPEFLAAQADVGRWVFGQRRPALPPPREASAADIAVVTGVYPQVAWRLVDAEEEAAALVARYEATAVDAASATVIACLKGEPPADVLHFAVHGTYAPEGVLEGLILVDGARLDPMVVKGCALPRAPFVFLNACQVGSSNEVLGDYSGMAEAFLHAGAAAVIAPLWSIDDTAAKNLALRFYRRVFEDGVPPATALREERRGFAGPEGDRAATRLAYQYFGHPGLTLRGARRGAHV